jgi:lycopene cyclase domain-containing protein
VNGHYLYLGLDILAILVPFVFSFHPRNHFYREWKYVAPAILVTMIAFVIWDQWFTATGVWGFNSIHLTGFHVYHLPIEEILFFVSVPYACLFVYDTIWIVYPAPFRSPVVSGTTLVLIVFLAVVGMSSYDRWYTAATFITLAVLLIFLRYVRNVSWLGHFYIGYAVILIPFFVMNGILTGTGLESPVVWYNNAENLDFRIGTIPAEDAFYGMLLILVNVALYEQFKGDRARRR